MGLANDYFLLYHGVNSHRSQTLTEEEVFLSENHKEEHYRLMAFVLLITRKP